MPLPRCLRQREGDAGPDPDHGLLLDAEPGRDLIGGAKADAADIARQTVWIVGDDLHRRLSVGLEDADRSRRADAVRVQEQHDLADHLLVRPPGDDAPCPLGADAGDLAQAMRLLLDQLEHRLPECPHQLAGVDGPDAADHAGAEIGLDALTRRGLGCLQEGGLELQAMRAVAHPAAVRADELAGGDRRRVPDEGDQVALPARLHPQDAEAGFGVVEGDPFHDPSQRLRRCRACRCPLHPLPSACPSSAGLGPLAVEPHR